MKKKIRLVIFDLDGTLVNAYPAIVQSFRFMIKKLGLSSSPSERTIHRTVGWGDRNLLRPFMGEDRLKEALSIYRKHHAYSLTKKTKFLPGAKRLLRKLKNEGYRLSVASNRPTKFSHIILKTLDIKRNFDYVLCGDRLKRAKPHPDILLRILKKFSLKPSEALYVGDMTVDIKAGKRAKIKTVAVSTGSNTKKELMQFKPYCVINNVFLVDKILGKINENGKY